MSAAGAVPAVEAAHPPVPLPCSDAARLRDDPMVGTAPPARRWLLLEQSGNWLPQAFAGMPLAPHVRGAIAAAADTTLTRILLVRRPGRHDPAPDASRAWLIVDPLSTTPVAEGRWHGDDDLLEVAGRLRIGAMGPVGRQPTGQELADALAARAASAAEARSAHAPVLPHTIGRLLLVCTHGRHDVCCAVRGRPVAAALAERWPDETWECSHVGGDRFAANVISLPDGATFGNLDADDAPEIIAGHLAGRTDPDFLRGVCGQTPVVQAAMVAVLREHGVLPWGGMRPVRVEQRDDRWRVVLDLHGTRSATVDTVVVEGLDVAAEAHQLTCRIAAPHRATRHEVTSILRTNPSQAARM